MKSKMYSFNKSLTALATVVCMLVANMSYAAPAIQAEFPLASGLLLRNASQFSIPSAIGKIESWHPGKGKTVLHIQTAHGNYQAQKNIQAMLEHLRASYGIKTILLEGAWDDLDPSILNFLPKQKKENQEILDALTHWAIVKGPELYLVDHADARGYGIEDKDLYFRNGRDFAAVIRATQGSDDFLNQLDKAVENAQIKYLPSEARALLKRSEKQDAGELSLDVYLEELKTLAGKTLRMDLTGPEWQYLFPLLVRYFTIQKLEKRIDQKIFSDEQNRFIKAVSFYLSASDVAELKQLFALKNLSAQLPNGDTRRFFEQMTSALPDNFDYKAYPSVCALIGILILKSEITAEPFMAEIEKLRDLLLKRMAPSRDAAFVFRLEKDFRMLKKLFALQLLPADFELLTPMAARIQPSALAARLMKAGISKSKDFSHLNDLDALYTRAMKFYEGARLRDQAMLQGIEKRIQETHSDKVVVVTGGFHTGPFKKYFEAKGYSYGLMTPKITDLDRSGYGHYLQAALAYMGASSPNKSDAAAKSQNSNWELPSLPQRSYLGEPGNAATAGNLVASALPRSLASRAGAVRARISAASSFAATAASASRVVSATSVTSTGNAASPAFAALRTQRSESRIGKRITHVEGSWLTPKKHEPLYRDQFYEFHFSSVGTEYSAWRFFLNPEKPERMVPISRKTVGGKAVYDPESNAAHLLKELNRRGNASPAFLALAKMFGFADSQTWMSRGSMNAMVSRVWMPSNLAGWAHALGKPEPGLQEGYEVDRTDIPTSVTVADVADLLDAYYAVNTFPRPWLHKELRVFGHRNRSDAWVTISRMVQDENANTWQLDFFPPYFPVFDLWRSRADLKEAIRLLYERLTDAPYKPNGLGSEGKLHYDAVRGGHFFPDKLEDRTGPLRNIEADMLLFPAPLGPTDKQPDPNEVEAGRAINFNPAVAFEQAYNFAMDVATGKYGEIFRDDETTDKEHKGNLADSLRKMDKVKAIAVFGRNYNTIWARRTDNQADEIAKLHIGRWLVESVKLKIRAASNNYSIDGISHLRDVGDAVNQLYAALRYRIDPQMELITPLIFPPAMRPEIVAEMKRRFRENVESIGRDKDENIANPDFDMSTLLADFLTSSDRMLRNGPVSDDELELIQRGLESLSTYPEPSNYNHAHQEYKDYLALLKWKSELEKNVAQLATERTGAQPSAPAAELATAGRSEMRETVMRIRSFDSAAADADEVFRRLAGDFLAISESILVQPSPNPEDLAWISEGIRGLVSQPQAILDKRLAGRISEVWKTAGNLQELDRLNEIKNVSATVTDFSKGHFVRDANGSLHFEVPQPNDEKPYDQPVIADYLSWAFGDLVQAVEINLSENGEIELPAEWRDVYEAVALVAFTGLKSNTPNDRLDALVKLETNIRKKDSVTLKVAEALGWTRAKLNANYSRFIYQLIYAPNSAFKYLKARENWSAKKSEGWFDENASRLEKLIQKFNLTEKIDKKTFAARVATLNIPLDLLEKIDVNASLNALPPQALSAVAEMPIVAGAASRWTASLDDLIKAGAEDPRKVPQDKPRGLAIYHTGDHEQGGFTGFSLALNSVDNNPNINLVAVVVSPDTWFDYAKAFYEFPWKNSHRPHFNLVLQNFASAFEVLKDDGKVVGLGKAFPGRPLGHGSTRGLAAELIRFLKAGIVYGVGRSGDNPTTHASNPFIMKAIKFMADHGIGHMAGGQFRSIGQFGGGAVSIRGVSNMYDYLISKQPNADGFLPDRDIAVFGTFTNIFNFAAILYGIAGDLIVNESGQRLLTYAEYEAISKIESPESQVTLARISDRLDAVLNDGKLLAELGRRFVAALPSEYAEKEGPRKEVLAQFEQLATMWNGELPKLINAHRVREKLPPIQNTAALSVGLSISEYLTLLSKGIIPRESPHFLEVKTGADKLGQERIIQLILAVDILKNRPAGAHSMFSQDVLTNIEPDIISYAKQLIAGDMGRPSLEGVLGLSPDAFKRSEVRNPTAETGGRQVNQRSEYRVMKYFTATIAAIAFFGSSAAQAVQSFKASFGVAPVLSLDDAQKAPVKVDELLHAVANQSGQNQILADLSRFGIPARAPGVKPTVVIDLEQFPDALSVRRLAREISPGTLVAVAGSNARDFKPSDFAGGVRLETFATVADAVSGTNIRSSATGFTGFSEVMNSPTLSRSEYRVLASILQSPNASIITSRSILNRLRIAVIVSLKSLLDKVYEAIFEARTFSVAA